MNKKIRIAHFISDEKFPDSAYDMFESVVPGRNDFFLASSTSKLNFIKKIPVNIINEDAYNDNNFMSSLKNYDFVVIHSLTPFNQKMIYHAEKNIKFVWIGMGYDYYDLIYQSIDDILLKKTRKIFYLLNNTNKYKQLLKLFLMRNNWIKNKHYSYKIQFKKKVVERIAYFSPVLENEYPMVRKAFKHKFPKFILWNYGGGIDELISKGGEIAVTGNNILLGNSASFTSNHIEAMEHMKDFEIDTKKIICPLSYGHKKYGDYIEYIGKNYFGNRFEALRGFLPLEKYLKKIRSCSNVLMNHLRQQGAGNTHAMLLSGAKIFLNNNNPLYTFYLNKGIHLFTINELCENNELLNMQLPLDYAENNKLIISSLYNKEKNIEKTVNLINTVKS